MSDEPISPNLDEEYLHESSRQHLQSDDRHDHASFQRKLRNVTHRLDDAEVAFARAERLKVNRMRSWINRLIYNIVFFVVVSMTAYLARNQHVFNQVNHLRHQYLVSQQSYLIDQKVNEYIY
jgi:hypothetical protein